MRKSTNRALGIIGIAIVGWAAAPAAASAGGARLYEMTENMKLTPQGKFEHRKATSELIGLLITAGSVWSMTVRSGARTESTR